MMVEGSARSWLMSASRTIFQRHDGGGWFSTREEAENSGAVSADGKKLRSFVCNITVPQSSWKDELSGVGTKRCRRSSGSRYAAMSWVGTLVFLAKVGDGLRGGAGSFAGAHSPGAAICERIDGA